MGADEFLAIFRWLGIEDIDEAGRRIPNAEVVRQLMNDPERLAMEKARWEHFLRNEGRVIAEHLLRLSHLTTNYLSDLVGGPVSVLLPRTDVMLLSTPTADGDGAAMAIGRSFQRLVRAQTAELQQPRDEHLLAKLEDMIAQAELKAAPANARYLNTEQIAARLGLAPKTVRKLCAQGQIIARKLAGGEWRSTQEDLDRSPCLQKKNRRGRAALE